MVLLEWGQPSTRAALQFHLLAHMCICVFVCLCVCVFVYLQRGVVLNIWWKIVCGLHHNFICWLICRKDFDQCNLTQLHLFVQGKISFEQNKKTLKNFDFHIFCYMFLWNSPGCLGKYRAQIWSGFIFFHTFWAPRCYHARHHLRSPWDPFQEIRFWRDFKIQFKSEIWTEMHSQFWLYKSSFLERKKSLWFCNWIFQN